MLKPDNTHQFALYVPGLSDYNLKPTDTCTLDQKQVVHRISRVLRLSPNDQVTLFDEQKHCIVRIEKIEKRRVICNVQTVQENSSITPHLSIWLPLLKREAFEKAIYSLVELGVNEIQPVITHKQQRQWHGAKEIDRIYKVMIAAAEQSKHFALPKVHEPQPLTTLLEREVDEVRIFFDVKGNALLPFVQKLKHDAPDRFTVLAGPEGDLTETEKFTLQQYDVHFVHLTPTVLRAQQALTVGVGALRSLLS